MLFRELSFRAKAGRVLSVEGANGVGKTSLLRMIAGLEQPSMPAQGTPLTAGQVAAVKQWIDEGANWTAAAPAAAKSTAAATLAAMETRVITPAERNYWAFKLPAQAPPPSVDAARFAKAVETADPAAVREVRESLEFERPTPAKKP